MSSSSSSDSDADHSVLDYQTVQEIFPDSLYNQFSIKDAHQLQVTDISFITTLENRMKQARALRRECDALACIASRKRRMISSWYNHAFRLERSVALITPDHFEELKIRFDRYKSEGCCVELINEFFSIYNASDYETNVDKRRRARELETQIIATYIKPCVSC